MKLNSFQIRILKKLLFSKGLPLPRLAGIQDGEPQTSNSKLDELVGTGYLSKVNNLYKLTLKGKEFATSVFCYQQEESKK